VPAARGARRRAAADPLDSAELAAALQRSVAMIGASGPPRAGLTRIRRKAKARQRRRTVMAGSAGVMFMAMAISVVTGNSFDLVPVLTSVVGLGGGGGGSSQARGAAGRPQDPGPVRTVRPTAGRKGPAIGPDALTASPAALAATGVDACAAADLTTVASVDSVIGGVSYGHVEAVAQRTCAVAGPPVLQVANDTANAASSVVILRHNPSDGSILPPVPTWGAVLVLQAGQGYDFQFAWAPDACPAPRSSGTATPGASGGVSAPAASTGPTSSGGPAASGTYQLSYLVTPASPTSPVTLDAACGATVYVTDVYTRGFYPLPAPDVPSTPQPTSSTVAPNSPAASSSLSSAPVSAPPTSSAPASGNGSSTGAPAAGPETSGPPIGATAGPPGSS
jgi:hypothetical protein